MKKNKKIVVVGAGNLGQRHLQGVLTSQSHMDIHIVDPSEVSRARVKEYLNSRVGLDSSNIYVHSSASALPDSIDIAIVATSSKDRFVALQGLLDKTSTEFIILEKFLFDDSEHYKNAAEIFHKNKTSVWVNTPRRNYEVYRNLYNELKGRQLRNFVVEGGNWGLGSSSIHFIDLIFFLTGASNLSEINSKFDRDLVQSKRPGYLEITGELSGRIANTHFILRANRDEAETFTIKLEYDDVTILIEESTGSLKRVTADSCIESNFIVPYQSEMTGVIIDQLINFGVCNLTPYEESTNAHLHLLYEFARPFGTCTNERAQCAIT